MATNIDYAKIALPSLKVGGNNITLSFLNLFLKLKCCFDTHRALHFSGKGDSVNLSEGSFPSWLE